MSTPDSPKRTKVTITVEEFEDLDASDGGVCLYCGEFTYGVEPDARAYECDNCGQNKVYGAQELLMMDRVV